MSMKTNWLHGLAMAAAAWLAQSGFAAITGQWEFNFTTAPLTGSPGEPIEYLDGSGGATQGTTRFGTTAELGIPDINGTVATVMGFGTNGFGKGYAVKHGIPANGGGVNVNQWTIIMDVLFPAGSDGKWRALIQSNVDNPENDDAEFYLNEANGLGINGAYRGNVAVNTWVRLAFAADFTAEPAVVRQYINGAKVGETAGTLDGRFSLTPESAVVLFTDGYANDVYSHPGCINSLQIHDVALGDGYLAALGGPVAAGVQRTVRATPFVRSVAPAPGANTSPEISYSAVVENGASRVNTNTLELRLNGQVVPHALAQSGVSNFVTYAAAGLFLAGSTQVWTLKFSDDGNPVTPVENTARIVVGNYATLNLPAPLYAENFDGTAEGSLPERWTQVSYSEITDPEENLSHLGSASYGRWIAVDAERFKGVFGTYFDPEEGDTDYQRVLNYSPATVVNGSVVKTLASGRMLFGNSGYRNGASQVLHVTTPDWDLSGKTNIHLLFHSLWEQNQDSIAGVEYSTDKGASWQPLLYLIDRRDIAANATGAVDAVVTMTTEYGDVARYTDPADGSEKGGSYGAFIGAPITPALAPFIQGRIDDDPADSKRVEFLRAAGADNQASVRFRFFHAGTDSWYFGIDNVGVLSLPAAVEAAVLTVAKANGQVALGWNGGAAYRLQKTISLKTPDWQTVAVPAGASSVTVPADGGAGYYRLVNP